ncbi:inovirus Gp2 family protein [Neisseriaceae bacterium JH1-16]|nr:inovirus Gp2 family protein [Neisseriaceae bacterium JH1-16]
MIRHPSNTNLTLLNCETYQGLPIQTEKGPFIREYLERLYQTVNRALEQYARVFAFRVDLRFPTGCDLSEEVYTSKVMRRFIDSLKAKVKHNRKRARAANRYAHDSTVRYVWTREVGGHGRPHYHVAILLNNDAFNTLGRFEIGRNNLFNDLHEAWASALGLSGEEVSGLVEIPPNSSYKLRRREDLGIEAFFYRASYLCKSATKQYGNGRHGFGASRH